MMLNVLFNFCVNNYFSVSKRMHLIRFLQCRVLCCGDFKMKNCSKRLKRLRLPEMLELSLVAYAGSPSSLFL